MMQTSMSAFNNRENGRRGHIPQPSISDESHHVTEAIGYMYDDDYEKRDSKRLSFVSSPQNDAISTATSSQEHAGSPSNPPKPQPRLPIRTSSMEASRSNGQLRQSAAEHLSASRDGAASPQSNPQLSPGLNRATPPENGTSAFQLEDIDYESNPAAVAQELDNLAALRRMSMDVGGLDPDLPSFGTNLNMPSVAPSASDDEDDTSRLFWVPAHLHPGLAPKEFKTFLDGKADQINRRSGELEVPEGGPPDLQRQVSGGGLRRKKSMLSRQLDTSGRSSTPNSVRSGSDLDSVEEESPSPSRGVRKNTTDEDKPILPPAPPGHSLRRSTRTTYRKGSLKAGERVPYSRRAHKNSDPDAEGGGVRRRTSVAAEEPPILGLTRVSTDPTPIADSAPNYSRPAAARVSPSSPAGTASPNNLEPSQDRTAAGLRSPSGSLTQTRTHQTQSNSRFTPTHPPANQHGTSHKMETLASEENQTSPSPGASQHFIPERKSSHDPPPSLPPQAPLPPEPSGSRGSKKSGLMGTKETSATSMNEFASQPNALPGNTTRTDNLSFIPTLIEEKKGDSKKSKDKKDSEGGRKSSWHWRRSGEDKDKDKKKDEESKKNKSKAAKSADKGHDNTRLDVLQTSIDGGKGRESLVLDRAEVKVDDDDRRKDKDSRKASSSDGKKEKEPGLFSSFFGGGKKKNNHDTPKKHARAASPEPRVRELKADIDFNWTRFSLLEERAIYRMAHIKLANPRRELYSQVLLSNFMYSYLAKVQQMHPHMSIPTSPGQNQQRKKEQPEEFTQYQKYQQSQDHSQQGESSYGNDQQMYDYDVDDRSEHQSHGQRHENGNHYGGGHQRYGSQHSSYGHDAQSDDDDMW